MNTDRHGRPLGDDRERDGRLLAAAQGIDLTAGSVDNQTRQYWYEARRRSTHTTEGLGRCAMTISHKRWVRLGDAADTFREWAVTIVVGLVVAVICAPLFFTLFLLLLSAIGHL